MTIAVNSASGLRFEIEVAVRLMADNASSAFLPPLVFTGVACVHSGANLQTTVLALAASTLLFFCYTYAFDAANQAVGAAEDALNKPHRPIPSGLISTERVMRRFWCVMPLYTLLGWLTGTLAWVLLWQAVVIGLNLWSRPRHYLVVKPIAMLLGTVAQLGCAWQVVAPLDAVGWSWVLVISVVFNLPLCFEDLRDVAGDRRIGRRTLVLTAGHWPVRVWFAVTMVAVPVVVHLLLFAPSPASRGMVMSCDVLVATMSGAAVVRGLLLRTVRADRRTYLLYTFTYGATLASGLVLL